MAALKTKAKANTPSKKRVPEAPKAKPPAPPVRTAVQARAHPAQAPATPGASLAEGSKAPAFSLPDEAGAIVDSASLAGKPYVIYFYPKDDTPGCTQQACDFQASLAAFNVAKVRVIGVSPDDPKRHAKFKEKYKLTFTLLSDTEKTLIGAYGVWVKKLNYGREYMGVQRSTFLVDKSGKISKAWHGVRVPGHIAAVLAAL